MSYFILETPIFQEAKIINKDPSKAIFRCTLQTCDEVNLNRRLYPEAVLIEGMKEVESRMKRRALLSELDHPFPQGNDTFDAVRQTTVALEKVSHLIRDYEFRNHHLVGEVETTSTPCGQILLGLLKDNSGIGFSMRGMASLRKLREYDEVESPLVIVAFDSVSVPSHASAVVNFNEVKFESSMITESCGGELVCTADGNCYLGSYFDKLVETKTIQFLKKWV